MNTTMTTNKIKSALLGLAAACTLGWAGSALTSCDDNFERPPMVVPQATIKANTTIADLKAAFYQGDDNYAVLVGDKPDGSHYIINGRVTTSDQAGNYFKQLVIADGTGAIQINIDAYDLYQSYQPGQEIVLDVTGLYIGAYGRLMQIGAAPTNGYPTRIADAVIKQAAQVNGLATTGTIEPLAVSIADLKAATPGSQEWLQLQNTLITIQGVTFKDAGKATLSTAGSNGVSRDFGNDQGTVILYTSGYSDFYNYYCPTGTGNVTGILSCYKSNWQVRLIDIEGLQGFDELQQAPAQGDTPDTPGTVTGKGTKDSPYTVADVQGGAAGTGAWVKGYIVGWVDGQVLAEGARFTTPATVASNILLAATPDAKTVAACIPVQLSSGSAARTALNLVDNPARLGQEVMICGSLEKYFGTAGIKSPTDFVADGTTPDTPPTPGQTVTAINETFDGSTAIPAGWTQLQAAGNKAWYIASFNANNYAAMTGYKGTAPFDQWLVSPGVDMDKVSNKTLTFTNQVNGYGSKTTTIEVYVLTDPDPSKCTPVKLTANWAGAPASGYSDWADSGNIDLSKYTGTIYIAWRYAATQDANYATWCIDNVKLNAQ